MSQYFPVQRWRLCSREISGQIQVIQKLQKYIINLLSIKSWFKFYRALFSQFSLM